MIPDSDFRRSLTIVRNALLVMSGCAFLVQCLLGRTWANLLANSLCLLAFVPTCLVVFHPRNRDGGAALTAAALFLNVLGNSLLPMVGTLMEGHAVTFTLAFPIQTFCHRAIFAATLLAAHAFAASPGLCVVKSALGSAMDLIQMRRIVTPTGIWLLGAIGSIAWSVRFLLPRESVAVKVLDGLAFLLWAPYLLLVPPYFHWRRTAGRIPALIALFGAHAVMAMAANSRMGFIAPFATAGAAWLVSFLSGHVTIQWATMRRAIGLGLLVVFGFGQLKDLSTAIFIERSYREDRDLATQVSATWSTFRNKDALANHERQKLDEEIRLDREELWQENYIRNPFLARFVLIKFDDNLFARIRNFTQTDTDQLAAATKAKIYSQIPDPVLKVVGANVDKEWINSFSMGDMMDTLAGRGYLGGFKTSSVVAHAFALFGWAYPIVLFCGFSLLFIVLQTSASLPLGLSGNLRVTTFAFLYCFQAYVGFSPNGVEALAAMLLRNVWQAVALYGVAAWVMTALFPGATQLGGATGTRAIGELRGLHPPPEKPSGRSKYAQGLHDASSREKGEDPSEG